MISDPTPELLSVDDLSVDAYVQRTFNDAHASTLAKTWDASKLGIFKASRRETGGVYVLDGQHRRAAILKRRGDGKPVPDAVFVLVYKGLTKPEEAQIFLRDNVHNRKPQAVDIFRISVAAEDPQAVAIDAVLREHGLHVSMSGDSRSVSAVGALAWVVDHCGLATLDDTLSVIENAWGHDVRSAREGNLLKGLAHVLKNSIGPKVDLDSLAHKLGRSDKPGQLMGKAQTLHVATNTSVWRATANVIVGVYNKGRTVGKIAV